MLRIKENVLRYNKKMICNESNMRTQSEQEIERLLASLEKLTDDLENVGIGEKYTALKAKVDTLEKQVSYYKTALYETKLTLQNIRRMLVGQSKE